MEELRKQEEGGPPPDGGPPLLQAGSQHRIPDFERRMAATLARHPADKARLLSLLQDTQTEFGFLPPEALLAIAGHIRVPESRVYSVATFYNQFRFTPLGKHPVRVCMGTACHMSGGQLVLEAVERNLDIKVGGITPDGKYSLDRVACVGCCAIAPVMLVGETVHPHMSPFKAEEAIVSHKAALGREE